MKNFSMLPGDWRKFEGYHSIPQRESSEGPNARLHGNIASNTSETAEFPKQVAKLSLLGALLTLAVLGLFALTCTRKSSVTEKEGVGIVDKLRIRYAKCKDICDDPCNYWNDNGGNPLCCNWAYSPRDAQMCSMLISSDGKDCYCPNEIVLQDVLPEHHKHKDNDDDGKNYHDDDDNKRHDHHHHRHDRNDDDNDDKQKHPPYPLPVLSPTPPPYFDIRIEVPDIPDIQVPPAIDLHDKHDTAKKVKNLVDRVVKEVQDKIDHCLKDHDKNLTYVYDGDQEENK